MRAAVATLLVLLSVGACAEPDGGAYPKLLPLSQLNAPPGIPAHAADAAADPQAVGDALQARRDAAQARARGALGPVADTDDLRARATALRARAAALESDAALSGQGVRPPCPPGTADPIAAQCEPG
ncbi:MAG TPA: hypothetical protein PLL33_05640 [Paracoccus sp. (in: a-proteobacteria)]|nr:hypothetical protein [Paracoccus sp. (in: a-proteobacteria)]